MCGIAGIFNFRSNTQVKQEEIETITETLKKRGPDSYGLFIDGNIALGHRRLAIIDLSPLGNQPMADNEGRFQIVFNGEIYNYQELRTTLQQQGIHLKSNSDTEVIIYLYKLYGKDALSYLRGMFAFAIWDTKNRELFLANDRLGKKPIKYFLNQDFFIFASELKAILKHPGVPKEIDMSCVNDYLSFQYVPAPKTGFKNIYKFLPAQYTIIKQDGTITAGHYWQINKLQKNTDLFQNSDKTVWKDLIISELKSSVNMRMISDVPLGVHLSGGVDSGLITALASEHSKKPLNTFSIGFEEEEYNELPYAKMIARQYSTNHHEFIVKPDMLEILPELAEQMEEPFGDSSALACWYLMRETKKYATVVLSGDGGDENFAGYQRYKALQLFNLLKIVPGKKLISNHYKIFGKLTNLIYRFNPDPLKFYFNLITYFSQTEKNLLYNDFKDSQSFDWFKNLTKITNPLDLQEILTADIKTYIPFDLLVKTDMTSMAFGVEVRSPFLDHVFIEKMHELPIQYKIHGLETKKILKEIASQYLPKNCIYRKKQGFALPLNKWLRNTHFTFVKDQLLNNKLKEYDFNLTFLQNLLDEHRAGNKNNSGKIWQLLMLNQWLLKYF